jgi:predicted DNA-binding transcriptional regulator AlpA
MYDTHCMNNIPANAESPQIVWRSNIIGTTAVCALLGVNRGTVSRRVKAGTLPVLAQLDGPNGALVFDRAAIEALGAAA